MAADRATPGPGLNFDATAKGDNPLCGDRIQVWVKYAWTAASAETASRHAAARDQRASADLMRGCRRAQQADTLLVRGFPRPWRAPGPVPLRGRTATGAGTAGSAGPGRARVSLGVKCATLRGTPCRGSGRSWRDPAAKEASHEQPDTDRRTRPGPRMARRYRNPPKTR